MGFVLTHGGQKAIEETHNGIPEMLDPSDRQPLTQCLLQALTRHAAPAIEAATVHSVRSIAASQKDNDHDEAKVWPVLLLSGESGVGKTSIVANWVHRTRKANPGHQCTAPSILLTLYSRTRGLPNASCSHAVWSRFLTLLMIQAWQW